MTDDEGHPPSRYMDFTEVAHHLGIARPTVYDKVNAGQLIKVDVGTTGHRWRITRASFDAYCARIEAEAGQPTRRPTDPPQSTG